MTKLEDFGITREVGQLKSGVPLVVFKKPTSPVYTRFAYLNGARFDPDGKEGLSHFMEHMLVAGTKKFPTKDKLAEYIENRGGVFGATTGNEIVSLNIEVAGKKDFQITTELANEMVNNSLFEPKTIETERGSIHKEIDDWRSNPSRYVWEIWRKTFFQGTKMGRPVLGTHKTLDKISRSDLKNFAENKLASSKLAIIISGDISLDMAKRLLDRDLQITETKTGKADDKIPTKRKQSTLIKKDTDSQIHFIFGFRTSSRFHQDNEVLSLISTILGRGRASVLSKKLRYEKGLVYTVNTYNHGLTDSGTFTVKTSTNKEELNKTLNIILKEIKKLKTKGFSQNKIDFAKNKIIKSFRRNMQTSGSWVSFHALGELIKPDKYLKLDDYANKIAKIDNEEIINVAQKYFKSDKWYLAAVGDIEKSDINIKF